MARKTANLVATEGKWPTPVGQIPSNNQEKNPKTQTAFFNMQ